MPIRIGGMASGLDIDSIVSDLMRVERMRVDKVEQNKTLVEWTRDSYIEVNKMFADFVLSTREALGLTSTASGSIQNKSVSSLSWVKKAYIADSRIADVSTRANAVNGTYNIKVHRLAENFSAASAENISGSNDKSNLLAQFGLSESDAIDLTLTARFENGQEQKARIYIDSSEAYISITDAKGVEKKVVLEGKSLSNTSLKELADQINKAKIGVTAIYDEAVDRFFLQTNETGEKNTLLVDDHSSIHDGSGELTDANFIDKLKLKYDADGSKHSFLAGVEYGGKDALIDFGAATGITKSSNQFTVNNMNFSLKAVGETVVRVETDEDAIIAKIKEFVNKYNELVDKISKVTSQNRYKDYAPLTKEQKEAMSEKEIELWEQKAKSGLLRNDDIITGIMQRARTGLYENVLGVEGLFDHITEIGIETETYVSGSMGGKLRINEDKLRQAIRDDVNGVLELLFKEAPAGITDDNEKRRQTGLVGRLYSDMVAGMKQVIAKAGPGDDRQLFRNIDTTMLLDFVTQQSGISLLDKSILDYEKSIYKLQARLIEKENSYWKQFTAMEKALDKMYSQSLWLAQQLGMK
ncbi:MAG TPA: flagellar filament capping protein FliD [Candidatus Atribacteria bacterium]|nr:flagellar filament capping protein FliD [Candidatus Atribacteria bacterium]